MFLLHNLILLFQNKQIMFNHSSDIDFKDFINPYQKCTTKIFSVLVLPSTLAWDNNLRLKKNLLEKI